MKHNKIYLPHLPKKYKSIIKWLGGEYIILEEKETEVVVSALKNGYVVEILQGFNNPAEDYVDISILEEAFLYSKSLIMHIEHSDKKDTPVARVGSVFVLSVDPKRYYALTMKGGIVSIQNLNSSTEWAKALVPEDSNKITFGELEGILPQNLKMDVLVFLPEPEELLKLLNS